MEVEHCAMTELLHSDRITRIRLGNGAPKDHYRARVLGILIATATANNHMINYHSDFYWDGRFMDDTDFGGEFRTLEWSYNESGTTMCTSALQTKHRDVAFRITLAEPDRFGAVFLVSEPIKR